jgi:hypothetical protein
VGVDCKGVTGLVFTVFVPHGDAKDPTRPPSFYDEMYALLVSCGIPEISRRCVSSNEADNQSDAYVMPSATILTISHPDYLDKPLKYMVSPAGFEPATY